MTVKCADTANNTEWQTGLKYTQRGTRDESKMYRQGKEQRTTVQLARRGKNTARQTGLQHTQRTARDRMTVTCADTANNTGITVKCADTENNTGITEKCADTAINTGITVKCADTARNRGTHTGLHTLLGTRSVFCLFFSPVNQYGYTRATK